MAASFVTKGMSFADIGTDHAYLPIYLVCQGKIPSALAMDIREEPLKRAREHIEEQGLSKKIKTRLSDGFSAFQKGEAQSVAITGIGGELMIRILKQGENVISEVSEFILSPHSEIHKVRSYLMQAGYAIVQEGMVLEDGIYYTIMKAVYGNGDYQTEAEIWYGKRMLEEKNKILLQYLKREYAGWKQIEERIGKKSHSAAAVERQKEVQRECRRILEALEYYK